MQEQVLFYQTRLNYARVFKQKYFTAGGMLTKRINKKKMATIKEK
ncbi:hypothetical protein ACNR9V_05845 [Parageobacillus thermoglucosidasius]|nr:hypothetical protein B4168_0633 [Anoxybacillus flavithermus]OAO86643.1 hypothetical protein GT23_1661 [Parageobacillus thermoglucosidasius]